MASIGSSEWSLRCSKKGDLLVSTEKRPLGKEVTLISQVEGNAAGLLLVLRKKFGTGGTTYGSTVEIQGSHVDSVRTFLLGHASQLKGVKKSLLPAPPVASRVEAEEYGQQESSTSERRKPRHVRKSQESIAAATVYHTALANKLSSGRVANTKPRCPQNWPYCAGWCYEPDSDDEETGSVHDYTAPRGGSCEKRKDYHSWTSLPWLTTNELLGGDDHRDLDDGDSPPSSTTSLSLLLDKRSAEMSPSALDALNSAALRVMGLSPMPCSCNDGSMELHRRSQKRGKVVARQLERQGLSGPALAAALASSITRKGAAVGTAAAAVGPTPGGGGFQPNRAQQQKQKSRGIAPPKPFFATGGGGSASSASSSSSAWGSGRGGKGGGKGGVGARGGGGGGCAGRKSGGRLGNGNSTLRVDDSRQVDDGDDDADCFYQRFFDHGGGGSHASETDSQPQEEQEEEEWGGGGGLCAPSFDDRIAKLNLRTYQHQTRSGGSTESNHKKMEALAPLGPLIVGKKSLDAFPALGKGNSCNGGGGGGNRGNELRGSKPASKHKDNYPALRPQASNSNLSRQSGSRSRNGPGAQTSEEGEDVELRQALEASLEEGERKARRVKEEEEDEVALRWALEESARAATSVDYPFGGGSGGGSGGGFSRDISGSSGSSGGGSGGSISSSHNGGDITFHDAYTYDPSLYCGDDDDDDGDEFPNDDGYDEGGAVRDEGEDDGYDDEEDGGGAAAALAPEEVKSERETSAWYQEALVVLVQCMGFADDQRTRSVLLEVQGNDLAFAVDRLLQLQRQDTGAAAAAAAAEPPPPSPVEKEWAAAGQLEVLAAAATFKETSCIPKSADAAAVSTTFTTSSSSKEEGDFGPWLSDALLAGGVEDVELYAEYVTSFLSQLRESSEHSAASSSAASAGSLGSNVLEHTAELACLLAEVLPDTMSEARLQDFALEATSRFFSRGD